MCAKPLRRLRLGLQTVLGLRPGGFFIPYRYAATVQPPGRDAYQAAGKVLRAAEPAMIALLESMDAYRDDLLRIGTEPPPAPRWTQDWFPTLDAAIAYTLVRTRQPRRIVEVGSGHSTRFYARAVADGSLPTQITAIDPAPRAPIASLPITLQRKVLAEADLAPYAALEPGDFASIDSSHVLMPGTDVDRFFTEILPRLRSGVLVHIHDVFLPDGYPAAWAWRAYNEQPFAAALIGTGAYHVVFASHYATTRLADAVTKSPVAALPASPGAHPASLWLCKT